MPDKTQAVYVSYAWGGESDVLVDEFASRLPECLELIRDKQAMRPGDWISTFEKEIGRADLVLVVISEKYLHSLYCMRELLYLYQRSQGEREALMSRIVPLTVGELLGARVKDRDGYVQFWEGEHRGVEERLTRRGLDTIGVEDRRELLATQHIKQSVSDLLSWIADTLMPRGEHLASEGVDTAIRLFQERARELGMDTLEFSSRLEESPSNKPEIAGSSGRQGERSETEQIWTALRSHALERLQPRGAKTFLDAVLADYARKIRIDPAPRTAAELVDCFANCSPQSADELLFVVRRALAAVESAAAQSIERKPVQNAAVALYCLAACRFVDEKSLGDGYLQTVASSDNLICGLVATVLTGLKLQFEPSEEGESPCVPHVYDVRRPPGSEADAAAFERAAYCAIYQSRSDAAQTALDQGPLSSKQRKDLAARIRTIIRRDEQTLALVVRDDYGRSHLAEFANNHRVPVLLFSQEVASALIGVDEGVFLADIREFWSELRAFQDARSHQPDSPQSPKPAREAMADSESKTTINIFGPVQNAALNTGNRSVAQAGSNQNAQIGHREGFDPDALNAFGRELLAAVQELGADHGKGVLEPMAETAAKEAAKGREADGKKIMDSLKAIEATGKAFDAGTKIFELCNKGYKLLASLLGLPPSPL